MKINNYHRAVSLEDACIKLGENSKNEIIAGGLWMRLSSKTIETAVDLSALGLDKIVLEDNSIKIGAMVSLRDVETNEIIRSVGNGILNNAIHKIMGVTIRNLATIGGSVIGKYGFSDIITPLLVLDTSLEFHKKGIISLEEYLSSNDKTPDLLLNVIIKKTNVRGYFYKMQKNSLDFAVVNVSVSKLGDLFKIAIGARPSIAHLAKDASEFITSKKTYNEEIIDQTVAVAMNEFKFGSNSRASIDYREQIAAVYLKRGLIEVISDEN